VENNDQNKIDHIEYDYGKNQYTIYTELAKDNPREKIYVVGIPHDYPISELLLEKNIRFDPNRNINETTVVDILLAYVLPFVLIYGVMFFLFRMISKSGGGMMG
ncbi:MAG TPA: AAA family ATPase, partial [Lachnoclostridium phytofermentans]|nr:AAA family ATPase [Lachnoclostridium phytofermentans]